jgi:hypothetical protein
VPPSRNHKLYTWSREIKEFSRSGWKTVPKETDKQRLRELEQGFHNFTSSRELRIRPLEEIIDKYGH